MRTLPDQHEGTRRASHDLLRDVVQSLAASLKKVVVTELRKGKGVALRTGFAAATREVIVMIDADGSIVIAEAGRHRLWRIATGSDASVATILRVSIFRRARACAYASH